MNLIKNRKVLKRILSLFLVQILLVFAFVLFGALLINNVEVVEPWPGGNVKFIVKGFQSAHTFKTQPQYSTPAFKRIISNDNFKDLFVTIQENEPEASSEKMWTKKVCFKEGIDPSNELYRASHNVNNKTDDQSDSPECKCRSEWHGKACSVPEIIWRAFMASRQPISPSPTFTRKPHNIFYIISGVTSINLETLEIQILELFGIVNLFVLCDLIKTEDASLLMRHQMNKEFLTRYKEYVLLLEDDTCSSFNIYRRMKRILGPQIRPLDVLIRGHNDQILNRKAVLFLKWHNHWKQPLRFRLRWNVYGFFFQHPDKTMTGSIACQVNVMEQFYKSDPDIILANHQSPSVVTVGDLNHLGGWFCEYCHQPIDIIRKFYLDSKLLSNKSSDPLKDYYHRKFTINIEYIQNLIQYGLYVDGKLELQQLRHYQDIKYFTPETVAKNRWKFDNIVTNFYASWDDSLDY